MKCPICNIDLQMTERQGVEIDYCPGCRGVWLDRGELDKIIDKNNAYEEKIISHPEPPRREYHDKHYDDDDYHYRGRRKKKGLLGEIFDF